MAARKLDAEGRADRLAKSLKRTIDTREKIVLGSLMKMVQLDRFTLDGRINDDTATSRESNDNVMAQYDLDLLVGALLVLSEHLNDNDLATFDELRRRGGGFRKLPKELGRLQEKIPEGDRFTFWDVTGNW